MTCFKPLPQIKSCARTDCFRVSRLQASFFSSSWYPRRFKKKKCVEKQQRKGDIKRGKAAVSTRQHTLFPLASGLWIPSSRGSSMTTSPISPPPLRFHFTYRLYSRMHVTTRRDYLLCRETPQTPEIPAFYAHGGMRRWSNSFVVHVSAHGVTRRKRMEAGVCIIQTCSAFCSAFLFLLVCYACWIRRLHSLLILLPLSTQSKQSTGDA
jgi:hypothetical protein